MRCIRRHGPVLILIVLAGTVQVAHLANLLVVRMTAHRVHNDVARLPLHRVALVLGAGAGFRSPYFRDRMTAAARLYHAGKVRVLLVSGGKATRLCDEPGAMKTALCRLGVPASAIVCDYGGLRTLDSVYRAKHVFGQFELTIVSQQFHNHRALLLARSVGIDAVAFSASDSSTSVLSRPHVREFFARTLLFLDLLVLRRQPTYPGQPGHTVA